MPVVEFTNPMIYNLGMDANACICEDANCNVPTGTCHCGCGGKTQISDITSKELRTKYGWPRMFLRGHNRRATWDDSVCVCGFPDCPIPYGLCHCGCGEKTRIAAMTQSSKRWRRDEPMPYLNGHKARGNQYAKKGPNQITREIVDGIPCVWIHLTKGKRTIIWEEDYEKVKAYRWWYQPMGYAYTTLPDGKNIGMHALIISPEAGLWADHKHGVKLDNRRDKLRPATLQQNHYNLKTSKRNRTGHSGIQEMKSGKFRSRIDVDGVGIHLGVFDEKLDAVEARKEAEEKYFGEFRRPG